MPRNHDAEMHPFASAREHQRAVVAAKLGRMFAKPFIAQLDGHCDSVSCLATPRDSVVQLVSGASDGELRVWDLARQRTVWRAAAHRGIVRGVSLAPDGSSFLSCGDAHVKRWALHVARSDDEAPEPLDVFLGVAGGTLSSVDHHWGGTMFATASEAVEVWDFNRSEPLHSFTWGCDAVSCVRFNPSERALLASCGSDRAIGLYDVRAGAAARKAVLAMRANALAWNPHEPLNFVAASEDHNLYSFDMRKLERPLMVHKDHVSAVMDVAFAPTGREFVAGSYDRTVRIFGARDGRSREVYHTKRMQRVLAVGFTADAKFVLSGSDDTNVRVWKARSAEQLGALARKQEEKREYQEALKSKFKHVPTVHRIDKQRRVPKMIKKIGERKVEATEHEKRKDENRRKHAKPGAVPFKSERGKVVVRELE